MKNKIPNTNLTLSETEIQAVVAFAYQRSISNDKSVKLQDTKKDKKSQPVSLYDQDFDGIYELPQDKSIFINYGNHNGQT